MASKTINISIDEKTKEKAQAVFEALGLSFSTGIAIYLEQVAIRKGIPFDLKTEAPTKRVTKPAPANATNAPGVSTPEKTEASLQHVLAKLKTRNPR
jgi:addiction module RelB/DinJ family antitoxin